VFIICCLVTITVSQLGALLVALSSKDGKSFANSGDLLVRPPHYTIHQWPSTAKLLLNYTCRLVHVCS
jgi:hypothetical protein